MPRGLTGADVSYLIIGGVTVFAIGALCLRYRAVTLGWWVAAIVVRLGIVGLAGPLGVEAGLSGNSVLLAAGYVDHVNDTDRTGRWINEHGIAPWFVLRPDAGQVRRRDRLGGLGNLAELASPIRAAGVTASAVGRQWPVVPWIAWTSCAAAAASGVTGRTKAVMRSSARWTTDG